MGFWIYMLIMDLLIPLTMIFWGRYFMKKVPDKINAVFGYRTCLSMKNRQTWEFAHRHFGKTWYLWGLVMLPVTVIAMIFLIRKSTEDIGIAGGILCGLQLVILLASIFPTERALRKYFDENGNRR